MSQTEPLRCPSRYTFSACGALYSLSPLRLDLAEATTPMSQFRLTYLCLYGLEHYQVKAYRSLSGGLRCSGKLRNATEGAVCSRDIRLYARPMSRMCSPELPQLYTIHLFCQAARCAGADTRSIRCMIIFLPAWTVVSLRLPSTG